MAFNGSGLFVRLYNWVNDANSGIDISATKMDAEENGFAAGLSNCITKDGQQTITADIPFSNNKITGLKDATQAQDAVNLRTLQSSAPTYAASVGGTANAVTLGGTIAAYAAGQSFTFIVGTTNTGAVTLVINGLAAKSIKKTIGLSQVALVAGDLQANTLVQVVYDGTQFQLTSPNANSQGADIASASTVNLDTATGDYVHVTGTTTITAITLSQGRQCTVEFTGALTLTNGASLINLSGADISTAAGDCAVFRGEASGVVRMVSYQLANGKPLVASAGVTDATIATTDITTNNVSTSKHGWAPKGDGTATHYLDGTGSYSAISGLPSVTNSSSGKIVIGAVTIQWGTSAISSSNTAISFGASFGSTPYSITCTGITSAGNYIYVVVDAGSVTTSGFNARSAPAGSFNMYWMAIGPT